ncbi:MAG: hypothetical protein E6329_11775, partial [Enterococcus hirae]|nr:hypothetical protein [Enterococcus hirae]
MSKKKLTAKRKKQLLTMFAVAGVMGNAGIAPTMALADTLSPTAEAPKVAQKANVAATSEITGTWGTSPYTFDE